VQFYQLFWLWFPQLSLLPEAGKQVFQLKLRPLQKSTNQQRTTNSVQLTADPPIYTWHVWFVSHGLCWQSSFIPVKYSPGGYLM